MPSKIRGLYIVIEGHDGTGKSTQVKLLRRRLKKELGIESIEFHEPAGTPIANAIRKIIKNGNLKRTPQTNLLLFNAARCEIWHEKALPALLAGKFVIASRNWWSTLAYQGYGEGLDLKEIETSVLNATDENYLNPNIGFILNLDNEIERNKRIGLRGEIENPDTFETRNKDFQTHVKEGYLQIAHSRQIPIIDASQSIEQLSDTIWQHVESAFS